MYTQTELNFENFRFYGVFEVISDIPLEQTAVVGVKMMLSTELQFFLRKKLSLTPDCHSTSHFPIKNHKNQGNYSLETQQNDFALKNVYFLVFSVKIIFQIKFHLLFRVFSIKSSGKYVQLL